MAWSSDPGDYIGGGTSGSIKKVDAISWVAGTVEDENFFSFLAYKVYSPSQTDLISLRVFSPDRVMFTVGAYENAQRLGFQEAGRAGMDATLNGNGSNNLSGRFTIHELEFTVNHTIRRIRLTFEQHSEYNVPAFHGDIFIDNP